MNTRVQEKQGSGVWAPAIDWWRRDAWLLILIADVGLLLWGGLAALIPGSLPGPGSKAILPAGYEGYSGGSWEHLTGTSAGTAGYMTLIFRMYGIYIVAFSLLAIAIAANSFRSGERWAWWSLLVGNTIAYGGAMTYDQMVHAIGPFELLEWVGLALIWGSLAVTWRSCRPHAGRRRATSL